MFKGEIYMSRGVDKKNVGCNDPSSNMLLGSEELATPYTVISSPTN